MTLTEANGIAKATVFFLEPYCERIEIAGSVRRLRPVCGDVDLVVIPKFKDHFDLLGVLERRENLLLSFLIEYLRKKGPQQRWVNGKEPEVGGVNYLIQGAKCQLDVFVATPATWATMLVCRTGSKEHNAWIAMRATARRMHWNPYKGLKTHAGDLLQPKSEEEFYEALGLPFIEPMDRERVHLMRLETELACR
jgi:DNA polymerase/3'-5' exonuclease PolX